MLPIKCGKKQAIMYTCSAYRSAIDVHNSNSINSRPMLSNSRMKSAFPYNISMHFCKDKKDAHSWYSP